MIDRKSSAQFAQSFFIELKFGLDLRRMKKTLYFIIFISAVLISACKNTPQKLQADKLLYNATFYTVNDSNSVVEAVVITGDKIVATGNKKELLAKYEVKTQEDLKGNFVYPGFIDGHAHFYGLGLFESRANLTGCESFDELVERLQKFAEINTESWLQGRGWDQNIWEVKEFPNKAKLDELFPDIPVFLKRVDGHAAIANQKALDMAGITAKSFISGGKIIIKDGQLTGVLVDNAADSVEHIIPQPTDEQIKSYLLKAQEMCLENGLTSVVDCGLEKRYIDIIKQMSDAGELKIRLYVMISAYEPELEYYLKNGEIKTPTLNVSSFKVYGDGALGSRGACLLHPYHDDPNEQGFLLQSHKEYRSIIERVAKSDFQLNSHCIGDSAVRFMLDEYGKALGEDNDRRWRIEHAQIVHHPDDVAKFGKFNILPSMQPTHAMSDMDWADERLGEERLSMSYALKNLMEQNGLVILGTDFPVEGVSPLATFYTAVMRNTYDNLKKHSTVYIEGKDTMPDLGFQTENALTRLETLKGMTIWAAFGSFEENEKGSIEVGKYADFTVLDKDLLNGDIREVSILGTWIGGERLYFKK